MIKLKDLSIKIKGTQKLILSNINLAIPQESVTYLLGPNGAGKSALLHTIMGSPLFEVSKGQIILDKHNIESFPPEARAKSGLFLTWQEPIGIPGLKTFNYLFSIYKARDEKRKDLTETDFSKLLKKYTKELEIPPTLLQKDLFIGLSGGEKKKIEVLAMLLLKPKIIMLDELDSGLDIDSEKFLFNKIKAYYKEHKATLIVVSHGFRVTNYLAPEYVVVLENGQVKKTGDDSLLEQVKKTGFNI